MKIQRDREMIRIGGGKRIYGEMIHRKTKKTQRIREKNRRDEETCSTKNTPI